MRPAIGIPAPSFKIYSGKNRVIQMQVIQKREQPRPLFYSDVSEFKLGRLKLGR
ncbi:hypothetical protein LT85_3430 [Collimonas arenae]|uniref:Uncharacterized protein n=1 Tax=Collimonas arenae TaxID=279058 RepID=A0A0A1FCV6_9BURK|nr:hypothetical protein LT85_3430 [Collimonas arenae]